MFQKNFSMNPKPYKECRRFNMCSVNCCPLDTFYPERKSYPGDPERKCSVSKNHRIEISKLFPGVIRFKGMTVKEYSAFKVWNSLTPEEQEKRRLDAKKLNLYGDFRP